MASDRAARFLDHILMILAAVASVRFQSQMSIRLTVEVVKL